MKKIASLLLVSLALFSISCEIEEGPVTRAIDENGRPARMAVLLEMLIFAVR